MFSKSWWVNICGTPNYYKEIPKLFLVSQTILVSSFANKYKFPLYSSILKY
jgi:hypothetical protein